MIAICSSRRPRQSRESRSQSALVGVRSAGSDASAALMSSSGMPICAEIRTNETRRNSLRAKRRWLPPVRVDRMSPRRS
jgi:hypothetical protein